MDEHRHLVTFVKVQVLERWKGSAPGVLQVVQLGGELDGVGQAVAGVAPLVPGEEVVLFLEQRGPWRSAVGLAQGVYRVERSQGEARVIPAEVRGLTLVVPPGQAVTARRPMSLRALQDEVRRQGEQK